MPTLELPKEAGAIIAIKFSFDSVWLLYVEKPVRENG
jgi:hypothetical protein